MDALADTSLLVSVYSLDKLSPVACAAFRAHETGAFAITTFHRLEFFNALRLRVFRGEISEQQLEQSIEDWESDVADDILRDTPVELEHVYHRARLLSINHTRTVGMRSLDLLQVAAALELHVKYFYSLDDRQRKVAAAEKLKVRP